MLSGTISFHSGVHTCVSLPIRGVRPGVHQLILYEAGHTAVNPSCKESVDTSQLPPWRSGFCFGMPARPSTVNTVTTDGKRERSMFRFPSLVWAFAEHWFWDEESDSHEMVRVWLQFFFLLLCVCCCFNPIPPKGTIFDGTRVDRARHTGTGGWKMRSSCFELLEQLAEQPMARVWCRQSLVPFVAHLRRLGTYLCLRWRQGWFTLLRWVKNWMLFTVHGGQCNSRFQNWVIPIV